MRVTTCHWVGKNIVSKYMIGGGLEEYTSFTTHCKSHRLMQHAQLIFSSGAGLFNILPMGMRALDKLCNLVNKEMSDIECQKMSLPCLSNASLWKKSGRLKLFGNELMRLKISDADHVLNPTHEEVVTSMAASLGPSPLHSLPLKLYQISTKFRDEPRPHHGLLRCREFLMKDLYTFDKDNEDANITYSQVCGAYENIFRKLGLEFIKASSTCGNIGGEMSHEYHVQSPIGEDQVFLTDNGVAWNAELPNHNASTENATLVKAIEIGHTFLLGDHYSKIFDACFRTFGKNQALQMGCYGIGITRLLAACVEVLSDDVGINWPYRIAPFKICIIPPKQGSKEQKICHEVEMQLYRDLNANPALQDDVIIDDRVKQTIGRRLHDAKAVGYPVVIIIGKHILDSVPKIEVIFRNKNKVLLIPLQDVPQSVANEFADC